VWDATTGLVLGGPEVTTADRLVRRAVSLVDDVAERDLYERMAASLNPSAADLMDPQVIGAMAYTPGGGRAVSAPPLPGKGPDMEEPVNSDWGGGLRIWDLEKIGADRQVTRNTGWITCVSIAPTGRYALTGSQGRLLRLWDLDTATCVQVLRGHRGMVFDCALTDDARYAISGSEDMTVRLWDLQAGTLLFTFATASAVDACDVASDGSVAMAGETSGRVHLFAMHT
jgi:WD40 repeat protein